ncbi:CAP domain-containing protein [Roseovarius faecimaris]|uniref:CAP domain-containing protein n=1 Tax=Roseovarius faecimaris TaxID=2494550 RepID=UPI0018DF79E8|nr:CAP domain-containing protein [Roseovarius faecimaris]
MSQPNALEQLMLELINEERAAVGAPPLRFNGDLNEASEDHSSWMLATDVFSHTGQGGSSAGDRIQQAGYELEGNWTWGENIAWQSERGDPGLEDDVRDLHESLMNSPGHRANILNPDFEEIGIGIERGDFGRFDSVMVTQNFGTTDATPDPVTPPTPAPVAPPSEPPATPTPPVAQPVNPIPIPPVMQPPVIVTEPAPPLYTPPSLVAQPGLPDTPSWAPLFPQGPSQGPSLVSLLQDVFDFTPAPQMPLLDFLVNLPGLTIPSLAPPAPVPTPAAPPDLFVMDQLNLSGAFYDGFDTGA